jgi:hypothetical protein
MRSPASILDRRAYCGMAVAASVGLACGSFMKPVLKVAEGPDGPQLLMPVSAARSPYVDERTAFDSYRFGLPDFVIGTDWLKPFTFEDAPPPPAEEPAEIYEYVHYEPALPPSDPPPEPPAQEPVYPSLGGDILAGVAPSPVETPLDPPGPDAPAETAVLVLPAA